LVFPAATRDSSAIPRATRIVFVALSKTGPKAT
jgi:hypothetical protein